MGTDFIHVSGYTAAQRRALEIIGWRNLHGECGKDGLISSFHATYLAADRFVDFALDVPEYEAVEKTN